MNLGRPGFANEPRGSNLGGMRYSPWIALALGCLLATGCTWSRHAQQRETAPTAPSPASNPVVLPPAITPQPAVAPEAVVVPDARESASQAPLIEPARRPAEPVVAPLTDAAETASRDTGSPQGALHQSRPLLLPRCRRRHPRVVPKIVAPPVALQPSPAPLDFKLLGRDCARRGPLAC